MPQQRFTIFAILASLAASVASAVPNATVTTPCACIFDVDRTLTGKQGALAECPGNAEQPGVPDTAYDGGTLVLSVFAQAISSTFCSKCFLGTISAGDASGANSKERGVLYSKLSANHGLLPTSAWSGPDPVTSPLVLTRADGTKQGAVPGIQAWYKQYVGVQIDDENVYFFDDRSSNIEPFKTTRYNARQISCTSRDYNGTVGLCGALLSEIIPTKGVALCSSSAASSETPSEDIVVV